MGRLRLVPRSPFLAIPVLFVVALGLTRPAVAQTSELDTFRRELQQMLADLDQQRAALAQSDLGKKARKSSRFDSAPSLAAVQQQLQQMSYDELARVYDGFASAFPRWRDAPQVLAEVVAQVRRQQSGRQQPASSESGLAVQGAVGIAGDVGIAAVTPDNCQDAFNAAPSWTDWGVAKAFEIAAQAAYEVIPEPFNAAAMIAWVPLAEGTLAAEILNNMFDRCSGNDDIADIQSALTTIQTSQTEIINNDNSNLTSILTGLNTTKTEILTNDNTNRTQITTAITTAQNTINNNTNTAAANIVSNATTNTNTIVNNDNTNRTLIVNNANANTTTITTALGAAKTAILDLTLRTQIEADLSEADNATPVAWYMTPTTNGGHLDFVETIVTETLANLAAAGVNLGNAQALLDDAKALKAAGRFKDAYKAFRKAYKAAAN